MRKILQSHGKVKNKDGDRVPRWMTIRRYKVATWLDTKNNVPLYGIQVFLDGVGWAQFSEDSKGVFFKTCKEATDKITELKAEFREKRKALRRAA